MAIEITRAQLRADIQEITTKVVTTIVPPMVSKMLDEKLDKAFREKLEPMLDKKLDNVLERKLETILDRKLRENNHRLRRMFDEDLLALSRRIDHADRQMTEHALNTQAHAKN